MGDHFLCPVGHLISLATALCLFSQPKKTRDITKSKQFLRVFRSGLKRFYFDRLANVFDSEDVRSYKLVCRKGRQVHTVKVCNCLVLVLVYI